MEYIASLVGKRGLLHQRPGDPSCAPQPGGGGKGLYPSGKRHRQGPGGTDRPQPAPGGVHRPEV